MPSVKNWFKKQFGGGTTHGHEAQPAIALRGGFTTGPLPGLENNPMLGHEDVHKLLMSVSVNYNADPKLDDLIEETFEYSKIYDERIPSPNDPDFLKVTASINSRMMAANEKLMSSFADSAADYFAKSAEEKQKKTGNPELVKRYEQMGAMLKKLAENVLGQQAGITNTYDKIVESYRHSPQELSSFTGKSFKAVYDQTAVYRKGEMEGKKLGEGGLNSVYKVNVDGKERVFKKGNVHIRKLDPYAPEVEVFQGRLGAEATERTLSDGTQQTVLADVNTAKRDVAVSRVDKLFGFNVAVGTRLVRSETGELSSLMELSSGQPLSKFSLVHSPEHEGIIREFQEKGYDPHIQVLRHAISEKKKNGESPALIAANEQELQWILDEKEAKSKNPVICIRDSDLNKSLMEMAAMDFICTHMDRHIMNYMIVQDGEKLRVQAIDNDTAFASVEEGRMDGPNAPVVSLEDNFPFVDARLKEKIQSVTPQQLRDSLTGLLKEEQIVVACDRLKKIQEHFDKIPVVQGDFTPEQLDKHLDESKTRSSYYAHLTTHTVNHDKLVREWVRQQPEYFETILPAEAASKRAIAEAKAKKEAEKMTFAEFSKETKEKEAAGSGKKESAWKKAAPTKPKEMDQQPVEKIAPMLGNHRGPKV